MFLAAIDSSRLLEQAVLVDLLVILTTAVLIAIVLQRMRLAAIPAYLITGALLGPHALRLAPDPEHLATVLNLAIILLLFGIGLEFHLAVFKHGLVRMVAAGLVSCVLTVLLGWPVAMAFSLSAPAALALSMALSLSSTAVVLRIIVDRRELQHTRGRLALSILVIQDLVVLAMLASLPALARWAGAVLPDSTGAAHAAGRGWMDFVREGAISLAGIAAVIVLAKLLLPRLLRESSRGRSLEVMMLLGLASAVGAAVVAQVLGYSLEMGAFLGGFVLAGTPFRHQLSGQIRPMRDLFLALFFIAVGMKLDPGVLPEHWDAIVLGTAALLVIKLGAIAVACWACGATTGTALGVGFALAQAGEFSLVLIGAAHAREILEGEAMSAALAIVVLSLIATPGLVELGARVARWNWPARTAPWIRRAAFADPPAAVQGDAPTGHHVVIGGFGPVGRLIAEHLGRLAVSHTVVELNPATVQEQVRLGKSVVFGDVSNAEVLESAGIARATALVLTVPDEDAVVRACSVARRRVPKLFIAVRTGPASQVPAAVRAGADEVITEELAAAEAMARAVLRRLGEPGPPDEANPEARRPTPPDTAVEAAKG